MNPVIPPLAMLALLLVGAYLLGAIPSGLLVGSALGQNPLRSGSGKIGAANTLMTSGLGAAILVFLLDLGKGMLAVLLARLLPWPGGGWLSLGIGFAAAAAIVGHDRSVWVRLLSGRWGGGRGIATALGAMLLIQPLVVLASIVVGAPVLFVTRYVVVATLLGLSAALVAAFLLTALDQISLWLLPGIVAWALLIVVAFHDSIRRLLAGTETRLGAKTDAAA